MSDPGQLKTDLDRFDRIIDDLAAIATRTDPDCRQELIKVRRQLSDHIGAMRDSGTKAFRDTALANEFRSRLSAVLNTVSMHQANWPAISIDEGQATYRQSAVTAATANRAFIEWTRAALLRDC